MSDDSNTRPTPPFPPRRRANPLGMAHAQRQIANMWALALQRFRDYVHATIDNPSALMEDRDASQ